MDAEEAFLPSAPPSVNGSVSVLNRTEGDDDADADPPSIVSSVLPIKDPVDVTENTVFVRFCGMRPLLAILITTDCLNRLYKDNY